MKTKPFSQDSGNPRFKILNEKDAAKYIGEKLSVFKQLVKKGLIPKSTFKWIRKYGRSAPLETVYYSDKLDRYIESKKNV